MRLFWGMHSEREQRGMPPPTPTPYCSCCAMLCSCYAMQPVTAHTTPLMLGAMRLLPAGLALLGWAAATGRPQPKTAVAWAWVLAFALVDGAAFQVGSSSSSGCTTYSTLWRQQQPQLNGDGHVGPVAACRFILRLLRKTAAGMLSGCCQAATLLGHTVHSWFNHTTPHLPAHSCLLMSAGFLG